MILKLLFIYKGLIAFIIFFFLAQPGCGFAQKDTAQLEPPHLYQYRHLAFTSLDILPVDHIYDIDQDTLGYIWLGTDRGVFRFDGQHFRRYHISNTPVFLSDLIYKVEVAPSGKIWLAGPSGLYVYHQGQFSLWKDKSGKAIKQIQHIIVDSEDRIWIKKTDKLFVLEDDELREFDTYGLDVVNIFRGRENRCWILCLGNNLLEIVEGHIIKKHDLGKYIKAEIASLVENDQGGIYIGGGKMGLYYWKDGNVRKLFHSNAGALIMDNDNNLWMGGNDLARYNDNGIEQFGKFDGLTDSYVNALFKDMHGDIWAGTRNGLNLFSRTPVKPIRFWIDQKLEKTKINTIIEDKKGNIWAGSNSLGILLLKDNQIIMPKQNSSQIGSVIYCLYQNKGMYVCSNNGVFKVAIQEDSIVVQQQISDHEVHSFFIASDGAKWLNTFTVQNRYAVFYEKNGIRHELERLHSKRVFWFEEFSPGEITMGTTHGLFLWKNGEIISISDRYHLPVDRYFAQHYDSLNNIKWFGTGGSGMIKIEGENVSMFNSKNGFPINSIQALHSDDHGGIWIAGYREVFHMPTVQLTTDNPSGTIKQKFSKYVLRERIDNIGSPIMELTSKGKLMIATNHGIDELNPKQKMERSIPIIIESFIVDDQSISFNTPLEISASSKKVSIQFTAIDFLNGPDIIYEYRLNGFEQKWNKAGIEKIATYTNLTAGEYRFEVRLRNLDESIQVEALPVVFEKKKHWYYTWPMFIVYLIMLSGFVRAIVIFRTRSIKRNNVSLQQKIDTRTAELKDLNNTLEQKVTDRTHEISEINRLLSDREERLRLTLEKTNTGLFEWYPMTSETYFSPTWFTMLGYEPDEFPRSYETWANLLHPEDRPIIEKIVDDFIRRGGDDFTAEFRMLSKQGEYLWIYDHGVAVERDEHGHLTRMAGIHADITQRKLDEDKLRLKEIRYQSFIANSSEHIWCVDFSVPIPLDLPEMEQVEHILEHGYYSEANEAFAQAYGATAEEVINWPLEKTLPRSLPSTIEFLLGVIHAGYKMIDVETIELAKDGSQIILLNNFVGTIQDGKVLRVWGTARDITEKKKAEEELSVFKYAVESSNDIIGISDIQGRHYFQNKTFSKLSGYTSAAELQAAGGGPAVYKDKKVAKEVFDSIMSGKTWIGEVEQLNKNGTITLVELRADVIKDENGKMLGLIGVSRDITEKKKAEEKLKLSEEKLKNILSNLPDSVSRYEFKPKRGFSFISNLTKNIFGYPPEDFYADPDLILKIVHPDDRHLIDTYIERLVNNEMPFIMRYIHKNGKTIVTEARSIPIYNDKGELIANESITRDITEIKKAEEDLRESEERYKLALIASNDGIWDWNIEKNIAKFSPSIYTMLGYKPFEFEETFEELLQHIHPDDQGFRSLDRFRTISLFAGNSQISDEFRMLKKNGEIIWIKFKAKVVKRKDDGTPLRIIGTQIDVTANKVRTQELLEAILRAEDNERSRISKDIHDGLQQTLTTSMLNFQTIKKEIDQFNNVAKEKFYLGLNYLQESIAESRSVAHSLMPKTILDYGIVSAFQSLVDALNQSSEETQFQFYHNLQIDRLDNQQIEITLYRILQESVNNILKYAKATKVDIQLKDYKDMIMLTIEDNGVGFDLEKAKSGDNGLGLQNIQNRIDAISGVLEIETKKGSGTTIIVQIQKII